MKKQIELDVEHEGSFYNVEAEYEVLMEMDYATSLDLDITRCIVWDGIGEEEINFLDLPSDVRDHIEEVARYRAERDVDGD